MLSGRLCGAILASQLFSDLGYSCAPPPNENELILSRLLLESHDKLLAFCRALQHTSPIDSQFAPIPEDMPGYDDEIVMAGGTFIQGSSIELSADAPIRPPYIVYLQGGLCIEHIELALEAVIEAL